LDIAPAQVFTVW